MILLIGGIIFEIGIAGLFINYFSGQSIFGAKMSAQALVVAYGGINDIVLKIIRDKNFPSGNYGFSASGGSVEINVCKDVCVGSGKYKITSLGTASQKKRKLETVLNVDSLTGEVKQEYLKEISL
mgnify:FL=1